MLELHAIAVKKAEGGGEFAVAMTALEKRRFLDGISDDHELYYNMLGRVNIARSDCSRAADRESIHAGIRDSVGFGELGRMVFGVMEEWMVGQLRAQAAAKREEGDERGEMEWCSVLGAVLGQQGRIDEAVEFQEKALAIGRRVLGDDDADLGAYMSNLANTYGDLGRHEDALAMKESVLEFRRRVLPPNHPDIGSSMASLANIFSDLGRHDEALAMQESALEFRRRVLPPNHPNIAVTLYNTSFCYKRAGDVCRAFECALNCTPAALACPSSLALFLLFLFTGLPACRVHCVQCFTIRPIIFPPPQPFRHHLFAVGHHTCETTRTTRRARTNVAQNRGKALVWQGICRQQF